MRQSGRRSPGSSGEHSSAGPRRSGAVLGGTVERQDRGSNLRPGELSRWPSDRLPAPSGCRPAFRTPSLVGSERPPVRDHGHGLLRQAALLERLRLLA